MGRSFWKVHTLCDSTAFPKILFPEAHFNSWWNSAAHFTYWSVGLILHLVLVQALSNPSAQGWSRWNLVQLWGSGMAKPHPTGQGCPILCTIHRIVLAQLGINFCWDQLRQSPILYAMLGHPEANPLHAELAPNGPKPATWRFPIQPIFLPHPAYFSWHISVTPCGRHCLRLPL